MIQNEEKSKEQIKAEKAVEQAKARLLEANRKASQKKRQAENRHKYMMGGIVHRYFPECYEFDEQVIIPRLRPTPAAVQRSLTALQPI